MKKPLTAPEVSGGHSQVSSAVAASTLVARSRYGAMVGGASADHPLAISGPALLKPIAFDTVRLT